jgi:hypothetical protein
MRAVTSRADLIIRSFRHLAFHLKAPNGIYPGVFFSIHEADWYIVHLTSTSKNELQIHNLNQKGNKAQEIFVAVWT